MSMVDPRVSFRAGPLAVACLGVLCNAGGLRGASGVIGDYECLTTPNGIPRKVIVKKKQVYAYDERDFTGERSPLKFFRKYFVFRESGQGYLVGEATVKTSISGWVSRDDVLPWDIEQALFFINKKAADRIPVRIWQDRNDIGKRDKPCFEERLDRDTTTEPFPILAKEGSVVKVAFLWDAEGPIPTLKQDLGQAGGDQVVADLARGEEVTRGTEGKRLQGGQGKLDHIVEQARRMDIVLVMDVTGSMGKYMDKVRKDMIRIVKSLGDMETEGPQVERHIGLVAYRDYADKKTSFVTKRLDLTTDHDQVLAFLKALRPRGGAGLNEAVCEGLGQAAKSMSWGEHSYRVMCLVGDAPPHTEDDRDTKGLRRAGTYVDSEFFGCPFDANVDRIKEILNQYRIQLYSMGVGNNADTKRMFTRFVDSTQRFLWLEDAERFIKALEQELRKSRQDHDQVLQTLQRAGDPERTTPLTDSELESLRLINVDPARFAEMRRERIQTGWFEPDVGTSSAVCVYMRRRELELWALRLRNNLKDYKEFKTNEVDILRGIISRHAGPINVKGIGGLYKAMNDIAFVPPIMRIENIGLEDRVKVEKLRRKLNNIEILLLTQKLFNDYEEGWVPMEYLPGSLAEIGEARADRGR